MSCMRGVPIPDDIHEQLPIDVQIAYECFHRWWEQSSDDPKRSDMPTEVAEALALIKQTPIPGLPGYTCADSCYIIGVEENFVD